MMTFQEMLEKIAADMPEVEPIEPAPQKPRCEMCHWIFDEVNTSGLCDDCQRAVDRGYQISQMAGRCANGAERDSGILWHARRLDAENKISRKSICGRKPGRRSVGWSTWKPSGRVVTCKRCLKRLETTT